MVPLDKFHQIVCKEPKRYIQKPLQKIIGFDTEAYTDGNTFMYCTSEGDCFTQKNLIENLFTEKYQSANFVVWNLKYESGAILRIFPKRVIKKMQQEHEATFTYRKQKYRVKYIPHKQLSIKQIKFAGKSVRFWDMSPFYGRTKLQTAAENYLHSSKHDIDTTLFTRPYVKANFETIKSYCIQDCVLTKQLTDLWISKFEQTGLIVNSLFSEASISFAYFSTKTDIITPYEYWDYNRKLIKYAFESYEGGKFLVTARGSFTGYEYDISSAYPHEIANLVDIRNADVVYSKSYVPEATYGFLRVKIHVSDLSVHLPCGIFRKLRLYPIGNYYLTITKQEYDYIKTLPSVKVKIIDAAYLVINKHNLRYPYRAIVNDLYKLKSDWKKRDILRSKNYKIILNGYYGKMAQCLKTADDAYTAGPGWNPIYASVITANTRIRITQLQNLLKEKCLAVHTDSVICTTPIPDKYLGHDLGDYELVEQGDGVLVACGIYEINGQCALKGFRKHSVTSLLSENPTKEKISIQVKHVQSWMQAMAQNHDVSDINVFSEIPKVLTLNCDTKRIWPAPMNAQGFLSTLQQSTPLIEEQNEPPKFWN